MKAAGGKAKWGVGTGVGFSPESAAARDTGLAMDSAQLPAKWAGSLRSEHAAAEKASGEP